MKKFPIIFLLIIFILSSYLPFIPTVTAASDENHSYLATVFNDRNGLPTGEANDVLQTSDGYLWIGSYGGLIRYDGTSFRNFSADGSFPSSSVRMMYEDSKGRLWIGTNDAGLFVYENDVFTQPAGQPSDSFLCIRGFSEGSDGTIYACSNSGVAKIKDGAMEVYTDPKLSGIIIYSIAIDRFGRIWCADSTGGCKVLSDGNVVHSFSGEEFFGKNFSVYSITSGKNGEILIGSSGRSIAKLSFQAEGFSTEDYQTEYITSGNISTHNSLRMMSDGTLIISGQHGLAIIYADGTLREFYENEGADSVNSAYIDYEQNIWLASSNTGIVRFSNACYTSPNSAANLEGISVNTLTLLDGTAYIGTDSGLIICDSNWRHIENELTELYGGENKIRIRNIISDKKGRIWIAAYDVPVVCYNPKTGDFTTYSSENGLASDRVRVLLELSDGRIAAGTLGGLSIISEKGVDVSYTDFAYPSILSLLETSDGSLLVGSDGGGIYEIKDGNIINHSFSEGLSDGVILRMLYDSDRGGYFISAGSSLYYWKDNIFCKLDGIKKEAGSIFDFYIIKNTLWLLQNSGILAMEIDDILDGGTGNPVLYGFEQGLTGSVNANTWHCLSDEKLYIATRSGISVFAFTSPEYILPKGIINSITIDGAVYEHPKTISIPSGAQRITIDFAALSYTSAIPASIAYQLIGFDENETVLENVKSGSISYTNLPGGKYTFKLRIFNNSDAQGGNIISFEANKEKNFTEYPLFWICAVIVTLAAVVGVVLSIARLRITRAKKRQQQYRDILEQSLLTFAGTIDAKDAYTNGHSTRVAKYSRELAKRMGFSAEEQENIYYIALLHDIGKIGIPDNILNKPGKLTPEERDIIQTHPDIGANILKNFTALKGISEGAKYHHERYDGKGYTEGKSGEDIPIVARIICVADTYDAMSSERCYRKPLSREIIISEFEKGTGTQFDPAIVPYMLDMINEGI